MTFEDWWKSEYGEAFLGSNKAMELGFKEVAEKAWNAGVMAMANYSAQEERKAR